MPAPELNSLLDLHECDCSNCGYNLYGSIAANRSTCSECGTAYRLKVAGARGGAGAWYLMVVAASVLFGGSSLYLAYIFVRGYRDLLSDLEVNTMFLTAPLSLFALVMFGRKRDWLIRRPRIAIWFAATAWTMLVLGFLAWWVGVFAVL